MSDGVILFCQCATIAPGGYCAKHGHPSEEDRLRRRDVAAAYDRVLSLAKKIGWPEVERRAASNVWGDAK